MTVFVLGHGSESEFSEENSASEEVAKLQEALGKESQDSTEYSDAKASLANYQSSTTFVPEGMTIGFHSKHRENLAFDNSLIVLARQGNVDFTQAYVGPTAIPNYYLEAETPEEQTCDLTAYLSGPGGDEYNITDTLIWIGGEFPDNIYFCTSPKVCEVAQRHDCDGLVGHLQKGGYSEAHILACRGYGGGSSSTWFLPGAKKEAITSFASAQAFIARIKLDPKGAEKELEEMYSSGKEEDQFALSQFMTYPAIRNFSYVRNMRKFASEHGAYNYRRALESPETSAKMREVYGRDKVLQRHLKEIEDNIRSFTTLSSEYRENWWPQLSEVDQESLKKWSPEIKLWVESKGKAGKERGIDLVEIKKMSRKQLEDGIGSSIPFAQRGEMILFGKENTYPSSVTSLVNRSGSLKGQVNLYANGELHVYYDDPGRGSRALESLKVGVQHVPQIKKVMLGVASQTAADAGMSFRPGEVSQQNHLVLSTLGDGKRAPFIQYGDIILIGEGHTQRMADRLKSRPFSEGQVKNQKGGPLTRSRLFVYYTKTQDKDGDFQNFQSTIQPLLKKEKKIELK